MPYRMRTFIAVSVDQFTLDRVVGLQKRLQTAGAQAKWVEPENLHITLLFLGEAYDQDVPSICAVVKEVCRGVKAFPLTVGGVSAFPSPRRPRTLVATIREGAEQLIALNAALEPPLMALGCYRHEARPYNPHLTLGRIKAQTDTAPLTAALGKFSAWEGGQSLVRQVEVLSSDLRADGPEYAVLSRVKLDATP